MALTLLRRSAASRRALREIESEGMALRAEDPQRALERFDAVLAREPDRVASLRAAGRLLMKARRYEDARSRWERLAKVAVDDPEPHLQLARIHRKADRLAEGAAEAQAALALAPHHAAARELTERLEEEGVVPLPAADAWSASDAAAAPFPTLLRRIGRLAGRLLRAVDLRPAAADMEAGAEAPRSRVDVLMARAARQARQGNEDGLVTTLETLLGVAGPTEPVVRLIRTHAELVRRKAPVWLGAMLESTSPERLRADLERYARLGDARGAARSLEALVGVEGPTEPVLKLIRSHAELLRREAPVWLSAVLEPSSTERLSGVLDRCARLGDRAGVADALEALVGAEGPTERVLGLVRKHADLLGDEAPAWLGAMLEPSPSERLIADLNRSARLADAAGVAGALEALVGAEGPTPAVRALVEKHRDVLEAADARLLRVLTEFDPAARDAERDGETTVERLMAQARRQARDGDQEGLTLSLDLLLEIVGPTPAVAALMARGHQLAAGAVARPDPDAALRTQQHRLLARARERVRAGDRQGFLNTLEALVGLTGPTPELVALAREHSAVIERGGASRLRALLRPAGAPQSGPDRKAAAERLLAQARRQARAGDQAGLSLSLDLLLEIVGPTPEVSALMARSQQMSATRREHPLLARARAEGQAGDLGALLNTMEELIGLTGPTDGLIALAREHRDVITRSGVRRLIVLLQPQARPAGARRDDGFDFTFRGPADPKTEAALRQLADRLKRGRIAPISGSLAQLAELAASDDHAQRALEQHAAGVLERLEVQRAQLTAKDIDLVESRLAKAYGGEAWVIQSLARQREADGSPAKALALYDAIADSAAGAAPALFHAATLAAGLEQWPQALSFGKRAVAVAGDDRRLITNVAALFLEHDRFDDATAIWRAVDAAGPVRMWVRLGIVRCLEAADDSVEIARETLRVLQDAPPLADMAASEQNYLIDIVRRLVQAQGRARRDLGLIEIGAKLLDKEPPSAMREWIAAMLDLARLDHQAALRRLDGALAEEPVPVGVALDLRAEKALIYQFYGLYGEAAAELAHVPREMLNISTHYGRRCEVLQQVTALCANGAQPLRYPECLFDILFEEIAAHPPGYEPRGRHVSMVSGSLGQGGGERQTITVVRRILKDPRVAKLSLLVRSTHLRPTDDFFLPQMSDLPVDLTIYGKDWLKASDLAALLPEFAERPRLLAAMDLLPHHAREETARLCRLLFDQKPQGVHIWQDIPYAAVACALVGVPNFFVHRGSLAPDFWEQNEHQTAVHFRPMRHIYRRLLERPDFVLLNNSISGCKTDQEWVGWPTSAPFQVVYNAVDFSQLGEHTGRNMALRRELGVPTDAPLIGGSFRIVAVKRPLYWIEAARRVREAIPNAQFVIIGDGDMTDEVAEFAAKHGFRDAVHLPGRVSNVGDWYRAMDLKLMTSEREGIPNAIIEAQHFGVPIVATAVGGIHEAIDVGETGWVVSRDDGPGPYAEQMIAVLKDTVWHDSAREKAPAFVHDKFSLDRVVDQLIDYYGIGKG